MKSINHAYYRLLNLGIGNDTPKEKILKIKIVNGFAGIAGLIMLFATALVIHLSIKDIAGASDFDAGSDNAIRILFSNTKYLIFIFFDFLSVLVCLSVLLLNRRKHYALAIFILCLYANIMISYYYFLKGGLGVFYFFIPLLLPVVFYDSANKYLPFVVFNLVVMYVMTFILERNDMLFKMPAQENFRLFGYLMNFTITFLIVFVIAYYFKEENIRKEKKLTRKNTILEAQASEIIAQRDELARTKAEIEIKNTNITDSINYAKNIQTALLPRHELLNEILPDHFILLKPRDIVSGDFY